MALDLSSQMIRCDCKKYKDLRINEEFHRKTGYIHFGQFWAAEIKIKK